MLRRLFCLIAVLPVLPALAGCDTDNPSTPLEELEGVYVFTELRFDPSASAIADADVLERLVAASTNIEVFGNGPALIRFKFDGEPSQRADADASATQSVLRLTARTEEDAAVLSQILFPPTVALSRRGDGLAGEISTTADLEAFDPEVYAGVPPVPGTLHISLEPEVE